jgi:hypothetical protein
MHNAQKWYHSSSYSIGCHYHPQHPNILPYNINSCVCVCFYKKFVVISTHVFENGLVPIVAVCIAYATVFLTVPIFFYLLVIWAISIRT